MDREQTFWVSCWFMLGTVALAIVLGTDGCRERDQKIRLECIKIMQSPERCRRGG